MAIVPDFVKDILEENREGVEAWLSGQLYERLVGQQSGHVLVRLQALIDVQPVVAGCAGFFHRSGPGTKPSYSIEQFVRSLLVKYLFHWSLRETEAHIHNNLLLRWFIGYGILEAVLDHSRLERFEQWVRTYQPRLFFDTFLAQIEQAFPEVRAGVQIGDTYACRANAAAEGLIRLLRHTSRLLLAALQQGAPEVHSQLMVQVDCQPLFGPTDERNDYYLTESEQQQRRETTARAAWQVAQWVKGQLERLPEGCRTTVGERVADLDKILGDEFQLTCDAGGALAGVVERDEKHKGDYRLGSATDREATYRDHGQESTLGYNVSLAIHPNGIICEIQAATGAAPDQAGVAALLSQQREQHQFCPEKLIYDQAAGAGKTRAAVQQASHGQTQLVARIPPATVHGRYTPQDFHLQADGNLLCPAQRTTHSHHRSDTRCGWIYEFSAKTCQACPLWRHCREDKARPDGPRRVFLSDYQEEIRQAQAYNQTEDFRRDMRLRPRIERVIFLLTHYDGARRARSRGKWAADFQAKMCATVRNLRTWLILLDLPLARQRKPAAVMG